MACRLVDAKPLSEPMLPYCQLDPKEHISVKFYLKFRIFRWKKFTCKCRPRDGGHFVPSSIFKQPACRCVAGDHTSRLAPITDGSSEQARQAHGFYLLLVVNTVWLYNACNGCMSNWHVCHLINYPLGDVIRLVLNHSTPGWRNLEMTNYFTGRDSTIDRNKR